MIGNDGNVYEGAGWHKEGAHTKNYNNQSIAIAFIGEITCKSSLQYFNGKILGRWFLYPNLLYLFQLYVKKEAVAGALRVSMMSKKISQGEHDRSLEKLLYGCRSLWTGNNDP